MTQKEFAAKGKELSAQAQVLDGLHEYFRMSAPRLHRTCELFRLFSSALGDVLEIGPFYGYTPFMLRNNAASYTVLEGDDPAVYPLKPLYAKSAIKFDCIDLFEVFGPTHSATHKLNLPDSTYDTILCWETMEHFSFNPVKFLREVLRVLKPGGKVYVTVPNKASFQNIVALLSGRGEAAAIGNYYRYEDYQSNGKNAFYGFHWREYSTRELAKLFSEMGFRIERCSSFAEFQNYVSISLGRQFARLLSRAGTRLLPRYGTNVYLVAIK